MTKRGRPPLLDNGKQREILAILSTGCSQAVAAEYAGCSVSTIQRAIQRDPLFAEKLAKARSNAQLGLVQNIRHAANNEKYWRAAAWALERFFPDNYAQRPPNAITVEQLEQVLLNFAHIVIEQVPVDRYRKNIIKAIDLFVRNLGQTTTEMVGKPNNRGKRQALNQTDNAPLLLNIPKKNIHAMEFIADDPQ